MLSVLDVLVFLLLAAFVAWGFYRQTFGMLISWFGFYISVLIGGLVDLFLSGAQDIGLNIVRSLGGSGRAMYLLQVGVFLAFVVGSWIIYHLLFLLAFEKDPFPSFGIIDGLLGGLLGIGLGIVVCAVLVNLWRVTASMAWQQADLWQRMYTLYNTSLSPAYLRPVLRFFNQFLPFVLGRQPLPLSL